MTKKRGKTAKVKAAAVGNTEYGTPIYATINASNNTPLVISAVGKIIEEAYEYKSVLYLVVNSGSPGQPPKCPPGFPNCIG